MPVRSGLIVVLKLFALLLLLQIGGYMLALLAAVPEAGTGSRLPQVAIAGLLLIPFLLIFWGASGIVSFLEPRPVERVPETAITQSALQAIAFSAVGAFILFLTLGQTIGLLAAWFYVASTPSAADLYPYGDLLRTALGWVAGVYLLLGGPGLRSFVVRLREVGQDGAYTESR
jgi:uncharacterized RDD family membrane protein YckC